MKVGIPKGMRDFSPAVMARRNYIFDTIKKSFQLYGFEQIETPAMENLETLTGKYGEEGDQLTFKVLQRGEKLARAIVSVSSENTSSLPSSEKNFNHNKLNSLSDMALRYDLTVPFARYVVQHQHEIIFPFKRFQIQPVWRADRPQKGRYREFYQCDADIIGSTSLINEIELVKLLDDVLSNLGLKDFTIKINNRKILSGIAEVIGRPEMIVPITIAIDKLEKIGLEKVNEELVERGLSTLELKAIQPLFKMTGSNADKISQLKTFLADSEIGLKGIEEMNFILMGLQNTTLRKAKIEVDLTLARGLNYYTGAIFEVVSNEVKMGSICGGGRYADLTGIFGLQNVSGVGISFGADRIYDVLQELNLFPKETKTGTQLLIINFGQKEALYSLKLLQQLRAVNISAELYPDEAKMKKQMKYANDKHIPYVILVGEKEMERGELTFKNMKTGLQEQLTLKKIIQHFKKISQ